MARTIANVLIGYGTLSIAYPVGGALTDVGYTKDGVNLEYDESHYDLMVEETTLPINRALLKRTSNSAQTCQKPRWSISTTLSLERCWQVRRSPSAPELLN